MAMGRQNSVAKRVSSAGTNDGNPASSSNLNPNYNSTGDATGRITTARITTGKKKGGNGAADGSPEEPENSAGMVFLQNKGLYHLVPAQGNANTDLAAQGNNGYRASPADTTPPDEPGDGLEAAIVEKTLQDRKDRAALLESRRKQNLYLGLACITTTATVWSHSSIMRQWVVDDFEMENAFLVSMLEKVLTPFGFLLHHWFAERGKHNPDDPRTVMWHAARGSPFILLMGYTLIQGLGMTSVTSAMVISSTSAVTTYATALVCGTARNNWQIWLSTLLCFGAGAMIAVSDMSATTDGDGKQVETDRSIKGDIFVFASTLFYAVWMIDQEKTQLLYANSPSLFWCALNSAVVLISLVIFILYHLTTGDLTTFYHDFSRVPAEAQPTLYLSLLWVGLVDNVCSDYLWLRAMQFTDSAVLVTICLTLTMPISMLADYFYQGRSITALQAVAAFVVFVAIVITVRRAEDSKRYEQIEDNSSSDINSVQYHNSSVITSPAHSPASTHFGPESYAGSLGAPVAVGRRLAESSEDSYECDESLLVEEGGEDGTSGQRRGQRANQRTNLLLQTNQIGPAVDDSIVPVYPSIHPSSSPGSSIGPRRTESVPDSSIYTGARNNSIWVGSPRSSSGGSLFSGRQSKNASKSTTRGLTEEEMKKMLKDPHAIHPNYYSVGFCFKALRDELGLLFMFVFISLAFGWFFVLLNWRNGIIEHLPAMRPPPSYENADVSAEWKQKVDALTKVGDTEISKEVKTWMKLVDPQKFSVGNTNSNGSTNSDKNVGNPNSDNPESAALALELLKSGLCDGKRKQMLDAGSGSGYFTILLEIAADSCKFRPRTIAIGIDKEPQWIGQSMKNAVASGSKGVGKLVEEKHVRFIEGDVTKRETFTKEALTQALPYSSEREKMFDLIHVGFVVTQEEKESLTKLLDKNGLMFVATAGGNSSGGADSITSQFSVVRDDGSEKGTHTIVKRLRGSEEDTHA